MELLRRGHEVRMAVPPNLIGFVEAVGLTGVAYGPDSGEHEREVQKRSPDQGIGDLSAHVAPQARPGDDIADFKAEDPRRAGCESR